MLLRFIFAIFLFTLSTSGFGQILWNGTEFGMTKTQVQQIVQGVETPDNPAKLGTGAVELLRIPKIEIVNKKFSASFFFKDEKLVQVMLQLERGYTFHQAMLVFDSVADALTAKYGKEISSKDQRGMLNQKAANWISGRTNINLIAMSVGPDDALLNISYQGRIAQEANKL